MTSFRFTKELRLRSQADFDRVYAADHFAADGVLVIRGVANELDHCRLGLSVSRKVGNAVVRNRWKRLIREAFRLAQHDLPPGLDLVIRPKAGAVPNFDAIRRSLPQLAARVAKKVRQNRN